MKKNIILLGALVLSSLAYSQVGINNEAPKATLDVTAKTTDGTKPEGIIAPRLAGDQIKSGDTQYGIPQIGTIVYATSAVGTSTPKTVNITSPGYYYFDNTLVWVKFGSGTAAPGTEPWFNQADGTQATANTQSIYQMGNVAIQKTTAKTGVALDIKGVVHGGDNHSVTYLDDDDNEVQAIGNNSAVFGYSNVAQGTASFAAGQYVSALGEGSIAMGSEASARAYASVALGGLASANGEHSVALGQGKAYGFSSVAIGLAQANGYAATAMGNATNAMGNQSFATGQTNTAASYGETAIGHFNAIITGNATTIVPTDALFQIGNGNVPALGGKKNAITVLQNGNTAIGVTGTEATAKPTELLDLGGAATAGNGGLKIRNINSTAYTGDVATDKVVVADANGVLKTVAASTLAPEPWQIQGGTTQATLNNQNIYQQGKVSIGSTSATPVTTKQLEVVGDFKSETTVGGNIMGMEVNAGLAPGFTGSYWINPTGQAHIVGVDTTGAKATAVDNYLAPTKASNFNVDINAVNVYSKHNGEAKQGTLEVNGEQGMFALYANEHASNWGAMVKTDNTNGLLMYHAGSEAGDNVSLKDRTQITVKKADGVSFQHHNSAGALTASYKFPLTTGAAGQVMTQSGTDGRIVWTDASEVTGTGTSGMKVPVGTTAQRPTTPAFGTLRYNTTIGRMEAYVNDANGDGTQGDADWRAL